MTIVGPLPIALFPTTKAFLASTPTVRRQLVGNGIAAAVAAVHRGRAAAGDQRVVAVFAKEAIVLVAVRRAWPGGESVEVVIIIAAPEGVRAFAAVEEIVAAESEQEGRSIP
jgi:hypothetical protein